MKKKMYSRFLVLALLCSLLCATIPSNSLAASQDRLPRADAAQKEASGHNPDSDQKETSGQNPDASQKETPGQNPDASQKETPGQNPDASQKETSGQNPDASQKETSDQNPNTTQTEVSSHNSDAAQTEASGPSSSAGPKLDTPSAILLEASTGTVIYEKDSHKKMKPASITKIMTMLLIFEALEKGQIHKDDPVSVSEHAASMGGSQVFLEPGEQQTVHDLLKCISIASANDACVAMAEYVGGSEEGFVEMMNKRAAELGMKDTHFVNCCGLDAKGHETTAYDISLMARALSQNHPEVFEFCKTWMDTITHKTKKGETSFGLTNTNKLIRYYSYATGLKTGYTHQSGYCLAATATRDHVDLIAVVMKEKTIQLRTREAIALLDYGFSKCRVYKDSKRDALPDLPVEKGSKDLVGLSYQDDFSYVLLDGSGTDTIQKKLELPDRLTAPLKKGAAAGNLIYTKDGKEIGRIPILVKEEVPARSFGDSFMKNLTYFFAIQQSEV